MATPTASRRSSLRFLMSGDATEHKRRQSEAEQKKKDWQTDYLNDLRTHKPVRPTPTGGRPLPNSNSKNSSAYPSTPSRRISVMAQIYENPHLESTPKPKSAKSSRMASVSRTFSRSTPQLRIKSIDQFDVPPVPDLPPSGIALKVSTNPEEIDIPYYERGQRWMEKKEAYSLREAMKCMDEQVKERDEAAVHAAAQQEAAELVWRHQNPGAPFVNPDQMHELRAHLQKGSHARSQSYGPLGAAMVNNGGLIEGKRKTSDGSASNKSAESAESRRGTSRSRHSLGASLRTLNPMNRRKSVKLGTVNESKRDLFMSPENHVDEESQPLVPVAKTPSKMDTYALKPKTRNVSGGWKPSHVSHVKTMDEASKENAVPNIVVRDENDNVDALIPRFKNGLEIRSDEIRAATSKSRRDRSPNLPTPTVVSEKTSRPIVSFEKNYQPRSKELEEQPSARIEMPSIVVDAAPEIVVDEPAAAPSLPTFSIDAPESESTESNSSARPLPLPQAHPMRKSHWSPAMPRNPALCYFCALPISGRTVSISGERFHPPCFTCHQCNTQLECVAFYPEPASHRDERLARIAARQNGKSTANELEEFEDGDPSLRFYCHLDFHELFSPRCRTCKTPIEGEVILACGNEYHAGHFFCAECGDPFEKDTPFVEKDGYAWCVNCHVNRYSGKCAGCRKPVTDMVVKALGREWHEGCFCCKECGGGFADGKFFTKESTGEPVCVKCEARRLKA